MGPEKTDDFSKDSTVDITVWKTLWRMWKALDYEPFMKVTIRLWVILRNNIYGKNQISQRKKTGKEGGPCPAGVDFCGSRRKAETAAGRIFQKYDSKAWGAAGNGGGQPLNRGYSYDTIQHDKNGLLCPSEELWQQKSRIMAMTVSRR